MTGIEGGGAVGTKTCHGSDALFHKLLLVPTQPFCTVIVCIDYFFAETIFALPSGPDGRIDSLARPSRCLLHARLPASVGRRRKIHEDDACGRRGLWLGVPAPVAALPGGSELASC
jgi:hypothetical protein